MSTQLSLFTIYNGTGGFVNRPASKNRAINEVTSGKLTERQNQVLQVLDEAGADGLTWHVCGEILGLHHGQISGALSNLHGCGEVFTLNQLLKGCHPYVHRKYRSDWAPEERCDEPVKTVSTKKRELQDQLLSAIQEAINNNWSKEHTDNITTIASMLNPRNKRK